MRWGWKVEPTMLTMEGPRTPGRALLWSAVWIRKCQPRASGRRRFSSGYETKCKVCVFFLPSVCLTSTISSVVSLSLVFCVFFLPLSSCLYFLSTKIKNMFFNFATFFSRQLHQVSYLAIIIIIIMIVIIIIIIIMWLNICQYHYIFDILGRTSNRSVCKSFIKQLFNDSSCTFTHLVFNWNSPINFIFFSVLTAAAFPRKPATWHVCMTQATK